MAYVEDRRRDGQSGYVYEPEHAYRQLQRLRMARANPSFPESMASWRVFAEVHSSLSWLQYSVRLQSCEKQLAEWDVEGPGS